MTGEFAAIFAALYVGHHVGDYWVQTDHQARHKGDAGPGGRSACSRHVISYLATQWVMLMAIWLTFMPNLTWTWGWNFALLISGVTHYMADRREHGLMFWLAHRLPGKSAFLELGKPRGHQIEDVRAGVKVNIDNPSLGTGAWALDQSWHLLFGVFVPALVAVAL